MQCNNVNSKEQCDWQCGSLLRAVVVSSAWPGCILRWFFSHMAALVGDFAGFLVPLYPVGLLSLLPSPFSHGLSV